MLVAMLGGIMFVKRRFSARGQGFVEVCDQDKLMAETMLTFFIV